MDPKFTYADAAAITVAVAALITAVWSGYVTRQHNRLSVTPRLRISHRFRQAADFYGIRIVNAGLGPAVITSIDILLDGVPSDYSHQGWTDALRAVGLRPADWAITRLLNGTTLRASEEVWVFRAPTLAEDANSVIRRFSHLEIRIRYSSMYAEEQPELQGRLASADLLIDESGALESPANSGLEPTAAGASEPAEA